MGIIKGGPKDINRKLYKNIVEVDTTDLPSNVKKRLFDDASVIGFQKEEIRVAIKRFRFAADELEKMILYENKQ